MVGKGRGRVGRRASSSFGSRFIRVHRDDILSLWERATRTMPIARTLDRAALINDLPHLLDRVAELGDELDPGGARPLYEEASESHAIRGLTEGLDPAQLVIELGILRNSIARLWDQRVTDGSRVAELRQLNQAIDVVVAASVGSHTKARDRTLRALDRIANATLESEHLDDLLQRLLQILVDETPSIQLASILVREREMLHTRASVGTDDDEARYFTARIGEGFAGTIAATRQPVELRSAATDPIVQRPSLGSTGVRALYGIPLIEDGEVIAVAHMGSRTAEDFSLEDKRLFRTMANRATAAIFQQVLRESAEQTTATLREREREHQLLADNIPQLSWMADETGSIYWFNKRWGDYTGGASADIRLASERLVRPDYLAQVRASLAHAIASGEPWQDTVPLRARNGHYRWFVTRAIPVPKQHGAIHWFGTGTDVTDQRFLDHATRLLNSSLDYHLTLEQIARLAVPDLADWCVVDLVERAGGVRRVTIAHVDPARVASSREWARKFPPDWTAPTGVANVIRTGLPEFATVVTDEHLVRVANDQQHLDALRQLGIGSYIITPLPARGRTLGAITLLVTESRRHYGVTEVELANELGRRAGIAVDNARLYEESQRALRDREDALRSREEVLAIVSHDLRNPLGAIGLSAASLLASPPDAPCARKPLEVIQRSADRMEHMINDLLDMATIQAKGLALNLTWEDPGPLIHGIMEAHEAMARDRDIKLVVAFDLPPLQLKFDRDRIEQVFANLIGNALKYGGPGALVTVSARMVDGQPQFSIADTGRGIPPEELPHLFEQYWAAKRRDIKQGTGLGLYICKGIVDAHGGKLWVESELGRGTSFFFTLPTAA